MTNHGAFRTGPNWASQEYVPDYDEQLTWEEWGVLADHLVLESVLSGRKLLWEVPDKAKLFAISDLVAGDYGPRVPNTSDKVLSVKEVKLSPLGGTYALTRPPVVDPDSLRSIVEQNYIVHIQALTVDVVLLGVRVISGDRNTDSKEVVFVGTEYPAPVDEKRMRILRVSVDVDGVATYEVLADTNPNAEF